MEKVVCPICGNNAVKISVEHQNRTYECPTCGKYHLYEEAYVKIGINEISKKCVKIYLANHKSTEYIIGIQTDGDKKEDTLDGLGEIKNISLSDIENYGLSKQI